MLLKNDDRNLEQTQQLLDIEKFSSRRTRRKHFGEIRDKSQNKILLNIILMSKWVKSLERWTDL